MQQSIGVLHPHDRDPVAYAELAAELGYGRFWTGELWGSDSFVELARAADVDVGLGTAIVNVYSRTPATLAQAAATVAAEAVGDMVLGLGTSTATAIESLHGMSFDRPVRRLHETAAATREILHADETVAYDGEILSTGGVPGFGVEVPVYTAALGRAARRATGRVADGWIPHNIPFDRLDDTFHTIAEAADERGRDPDAITVSPYVPCAASDDPAEAQAAIKGHIAYYVGSGEGYRRAVGESFPEAADSIASAWGSGDREEARDMVTDEMVAELGVAGTPETARERFREVVAMDAIDAPIVVVPRNATHLAETTIRALGPVAADGP